MHTCSHFRARRCQIRAQKKTSLRLARATRAVTSFLCRTALTSRPDWEGSVQSQPHYYLALHPHNLEPSKASKTQVSAPNCSGLSGAHVCEDACECLHAASSAPSTMVRFPQAVPFPNTLLFSIIFMPTPPPPSPSPSLLIMDLTELASHATASGGRAT